MISGCQEFETIQEMKKMCVSVIRKFLSYISSTVIHSLISVLVVIRFLNDFRTVIDGQPRRGSVFMMSAELVNVTQVICLSVLMLVCVNIHACTEQLPHSSKRTDCWLP